jgi:hypothetical protein
MGGWRGLTMEGERFGRRQHVRKRRMMHDCLWFELRGNTSASAVIKRGRPIKRNLAPPHLPELSYTPRLQREVVHTPVCNTILNGISLPVNAASLHITAAPPSVSTTSVSVNEPTALHIHIPLSRDDGGSGGVAVDLRPDYSHLLVLTGTRSCAAGEGHTDASTSNLPQIDHATLPRHAVAMAAASSHLIEHADPTQLPQLPSALYCPSQRVSADTESWPRMSRTAGRTMVRCAKPHGAAAHSNPHTATYLLGTHIESPSEAPSHPASLAALALSPRAPVQPAPHPLHTAFHGVQPTHTAARPMGAATGRSAVLPFGLDEAAKAKAATGAFLREERGGTILARHVYPVPWSAPTGISI